MGPVVGLRDLNRSATHRVAEFARIQMDNRSRAEFLRIQLRSAGKTRVIVAEQRIMRTWMAWVLTACLCVASISGCGAVSEDELGEPVDVSQTPGADEPYDLEQLLPKEGEESTADESAATPEGA